MNSCFPPLAALTLKDKRRNSAYLETTGNQTSGKPNVIQDMEMFYIKQIAHNLKVRTKKILIVRIPIVLNVLVTKLLQRFNLYRFTIHIFIIIFLHNM